MNAVVQPAVEQAPSFAAIKDKQRATWAAGDYAAVGATLQIVGERLCEAMDLRADERFLDVAAGNGNVSLAAARRSCQVTSTDYVQMLLDRGRARAEADGFQIEFQLADAEALPFADGSFDSVASTFGVMFTPDHETAANELQRVCRRGGRIGLANWTPDGFVGQIFRTIGGFVPPPPGVQSPALWGTEEHLRSLFGEHASAVAITPRTFVFRYRSPEHWVNLWRGIYGPICKAFAALDEEAQARLTTALIELAQNFNTASDSTMVVPGKYLEVVVTTKA